MQASSNETDHLLVDQMRHEADGGEACGFVVTPEALLELQHETLEHEFTDLRKLHKNHKRKFFFVYEYMMLMVDNITFVLMIAMRAA